MCLVDDDGNVDYYDGRLRVVDEQKKLVREFDYRDYLDHISEGVEKWTDIKFPFLTDLGRDAGSVRVGPLARLNVTRGLTPASPVRASTVTKGRSRCCWLAVVR